jgi:nicotinamidase-related amidase
MKAETLNAVRLPAAMPGGFTLHKLSSPQNRRKNQLKAQVGQQSDLHGSAPDTNIAALLLIDVINHFEFPRGEDLLCCSFPIAAKIAALKRKARAAGVPVIYVNDNFGRWRSSHKELLEHCLTEGVPGKPFVEQLAPDEEDYFVLKPKHSGFYQTPLEVLLKHLGTERLVITGVSTNSCVLFTANDAYMRDLEVVVPPDCVAACSSTEHCSALEEMKTMLKARLIPSEEIDFNVLNSADAL